MRRRKHLRVALLVVVLVALAQVALAQRDSDPWGYESNGAGAVPPASGGSPSASAGRATLTFDPWAPLLGSLPLPIVIPLG